MAKAVLSQNEVEALLASHKPGAAAAPPAAPGESASHGKVSLYDFRRPTRVGDAQIRALQSLHEGFGRNFGAALSALLRTVVEVQLVRIDQVAYDEFLSSLEPPTCFHVLSAAPLDGNVVLDLSPSIIYPLIDRLLGGGRETMTTPKRPLTEIEQRLAARITALALDALRIVWAGVQPIDFKVTRTEADPRLVHVMPPSEAIVMTAFELTLGAFRGTMSLCMPLGVIQPVIGKLSSGACLAGASRRTSDAHVQDLERSLTGATVELVVDLAETQLSTEELIGLHVGDLIKTEKSAAGGLLVSVEGVPKFRARPGVWKDRTAVCITGPADHNARIN